MPRPFLSGEREAHKQDDYLQTGYKRVTVHRGHVEPVDVVPTAPEDKGTQVL